VTAALPPLGGAATPPPAQRGLGAAIACIALFGVAQGMTHPLFALRLENQGWSSGMIGLNGAMVALASLTLAPFMPRAIRVMGLPAFLAAGAALSAAALGATPFFDGYGAWLALRFVQGAAATALFLGSEAWIVADADDASRGRIVGLYATALSLGFAAGPMILTGVGVAGAAPFAVCAALSLLCLLPLATAWRLAPPLHHDGGGGPPPLGFLRSDPTVMGAVILFGAIEFGVIGLLPVWGVKIGLDAAGASFLVSTLVLGNVALQLPLGALADRVNRRALLMVCAGASFLAAAALPLLADAGWALWAALFVWGGLAAGLYTVALIELGARYRGAALVSANAAVIASYGIGALAGPMLVGGAMDAVEPHGIALALAAMAAVYLGVAARRALTARRRVREAAPRP
jgi:MFS family permease